MLLKPETAPQLRLRGRSLMALVVAPEPPLAAWFAALDAQLAGTPDLSEGRPVVADLSAVADESREDLLILLEGLEARGLRVVAVEGARGRLVGTGWASAAEPLPGRDGPAPIGRARTPRPTSLLIDRPVRSGQSVVFEEGDVTVVGAVASGAEVIAGGSIHVYGALRGRAIAGLKHGGEARIFCSRFEAEMVGIDRVYRTAEHWGAELHGQSVQARFDRGALRLSRLD